jgi:streptomycin 6-kinase
VAVAPRPLRGDPHYEPAPMLWHRFEELSGRVRDGVRDRFFALVDGAGLDEDRARAWVVVRAVALAAEAPDLATVAIAVIKAVQE